MGDCWVNGVLGNVSLNACIVILLVQVFWEEAALCATCVCVCVCVCDCVCVRERERKGERERKCISQHVYCHFACPCLLGGSRAVCDVCAYVCVCMYACVCVCERERETQRKSVEI